MSQNMDARITANLPLAAWLYNVAPELAAGKFLSGFNDPRAVYARCLDCVAP